jgi:acyl-CoA synthetase (NDP forming)
MNIIETAIKKGQSTLSEYESKQILSAYKIPVTKEMLATDKDSLLKATKEIGYPLVLKGCSADITHKTESGIIHIDIRNDDEANEAYKAIKAGMNNNGEWAVLIQEMIKGKRELVAGMTRDPQFGPCVMFGLGGIFTEVLKDITFRMAPLSKQDAMDMICEIKAYKLLEPIRGMAAADLDMLSDILINLGQIGLENNDVKEIDINPIIISGNRPVAVDALVILETSNVKPLA